MWINRPGVPFESQKLLNGSRPQKLWSYATDRLYWLVCIGAEIFRDLARYLGPLEGRNQSNCAYLGDVLYLEIYQYVSGTSLTITKGFKRIECTSKPTNAWHCLDFVESLFIVDTSCVSAEYAIRSGSVAILLFPLKESRNPISKPDTCVIVVGLTQERIWCLRTEMGSSYPRCVPGRGKSLRRWRVSTVSRRGCEGTRSRSFALVRS